MDRKHNIPNDLAECQRLLLAAFKQTVQLEQRAAELDRVLDATSASYQELREEHASTLDELAWYKRWVHGRRRERIVEGEGQQHLFDLTPPEETEVPAPLQEPRQQIAGHTRRRRRELDLSRLPHHRHELDLSPTEKTCSCCGRAKDRIGEDVTTILEHVPSKLEVHEHVRPKYACRYCKNGVSSPPLYRLEATKAADRSGRREAEGGSQRPFATACTLPGVRCAIGCPRRRSCFNRSTNYNGGWCYSLQ